MKLFEPVAIGSVWLKNRIVMAPITTLFTDHGFVTDRLINFYEERAKGGVGLIMLEDAIVDSSLGKNVKEVLCLDDDRYIPGLQKLISTIKKYDAKVAVQLSHAGRRAGRLDSNSGCLEMTGGRIPVAPSSIAHPTPGHVVPRELSAEEIEEIIKKFGEAARRAAESGCDLISLHCAHMYLCGQFLSPWANQRTDMYGGTLQNRLRFVLEVVREIKREVGEEIPLMCRINGEEPRGGNTPEEIQTIAQALERAGVKALSVSVGFGAVIKDETFLPAEAPIGAPEGCIVHLAERIKRVVSVPVIVGNKIRDPQFAEDVLRQGKADLISLARPLLADPAWAQKARDGLVDEIRPCISCCQGCVGNVLKDLPIKCALNPLVGREGEVQPRPAMNKRNVLVIGAGPAGLEAAAVCAGRGHTVTIWEKESDIGGQLLIAQKPPHKGELRKLIDYYKHRITQLDISLELNKEATKQAITDFRPDVLIIATGSNPKELDFPGANRLNVVTARAVLRDDLDLGDSIIVVGGGQVGLEVAEYLAEKGKKVTVVELLEEVGRDLTPLLRVPLLLRLQKLAVRIYTRCKLKEATDRGVVLEHRGREIFVEATDIVIAVGAEPNELLKNELETIRSVGTEVYYVGDCNMPGKIIDAIHAAFEVACKV